ANLHFNVIGDPTYKTAQDWFDVIQSSGILEGFMLSNSRLSTELDVSAGKGIIKETDSELGATVSFETSAVENITLTSDNINYIYVDYNAGTPQIVATTDRALIELNRMFIIGRVYKNGADLHVLNAGVHISNLARSEHERLVERDGFTYTSGSVTSETGTLNLDITAGVWYLGHNRLTTDTLNSDTGGDTWAYTHYGAASWITDNSTASAVDCTHYNAGTDALGTLGSNNYGTQWIYITADSYWYIIYGVENGQLVAAENASPPVSIPTYIETMGELLAKMIVKEDGTIVDIQIVHAITFTPAGITNHNETGGIQGGDANEYYHLTLAQHVDLTDGGDSTSHKHDDRYYTESEVNTISGSLNTKIDGKADTSHSHTEGDISDLDKYTQLEVNTISGSLSSEIDTDIATHTSNADVHHNESHTVVSHSDTTATGANLNELVGAGDTTLHKHDGQYYTESEVDTISGSLNTKIDGK
ncbi:MAG: hypothetical protein KAS66_14785, partial [Candidatus Omnitrophica bacterium]|nr:hypothetical protein [Candidatus Omnitrophota bacterium]